MRRVVMAVALLAIAGGGAWFLQRNFEFTNSESGWKVAPREPTGPTSTPPARAVSKIRLASFNIQVFGNTKLSKPQVMEKLAQIVRRFDVVAIQEIRSQSDDVIPRFVELINASGRHYDYVIGPRIGRTQSKEQYAFIFDMQTIEVDRNQLYTIDDPDDLLHRPPLVGWFRTRGPSLAEAFTFTLVNLHTDPDEVESELRVLDGVFRVVREDGRQEDDVILLGDFNADYKKINEVMQIASVRCAIMGAPTNVRGTKEYDNLVFQPLATDEYTGRYGVFDFLREYNLTVEAAEEISDHFPVWAEFTAHEGGQPGRIARQTSAIDTRTN